MPGMDPSMVGSAVDAAVNLFKVGQGVAQGIKANKEAKKIVPLHYDLQQPILDNQAIAERNASQGLSDGAREVYQDQLDRGLGNSVDALLRGGGGVNSFSELYGNMADHADTIRALEDELRQKNQRTLMDQNGRLAEELDKQWQINVLKPHEDQSAYVAGLRGMSQKNISGGLDGIGAAGINYATSQLYKNDGTPSAGTPEFSHPDARTGAVDPTGLLGPVLPMDRTNMFSNVVQSPGFNLFQTNTPKLYPWQ